MNFRRETKNDLKEIVLLLADDELGSTRERYEEPLPEKYYKAFLEMENQEGNEMLLAVEDDQIIGCLQLIIIPGLARLGMKRGQIEAVRVDKAYRGKKIGEALFREAIRRSEAKGCGLVQLTTDKKRPEAHRFYEKLGFEPSHEGMKLIL